MSRPAPLSEVTLEGGDRLSAALARLDGDTAHRVYRPRSTFTVCGVRTRALVAVTWGELNGRYQLCRRCWAAQVLRLTREGLA